MKFSGKKLIFITGASRSGTTLLSFVLRNHSDIFGLKELHYFGDQWDPRNEQSSMSPSELLEAIASIYKFQAEGILTTSSAEAYRLKAQALIESLPKEQRNPTDAFAATVTQIAEADGKHIACEQTPRNIFYAEALLKKFPNSHVIHIVRDPRAVMASQKKRWQRRKFATDTAGVSRYQSLRVWVNYHPFTVARLWRRATQTALRLKGSPRFTIIRFEDLVCDAEETVSALSQSIEIDFQPAMLEVGRVNSSHESSVGGAKKGLHADAIDTWHAALTPGEITITEKLCGSQMDAFDFERSTDKAPTFAELPYRISYLFHLLGVMLINPKRAIVQLRALTGVRKASG